MVLRFHKVLRPGCAAEEGQRLTPPQRAWACRACFYSSTNAPTAAEWNICAGWGACTHSVPKRGPSPKQRSVGDRRICASAGAQSKTGQTFPKGSSALTSATMLERSSPHVPQAVPREEAPSALRSPRASDFPGETHALISPLYYTTHHSCITCYILHTQYAPHLAKVLEQGGRFLNSPAQPSF
jgi:hypothetical protein